MAYSLRGARLAAESNLWRSANVPGGSTAAELTIMGWVYWRSFLVNGAILDVINTGSPPTCERALYTSTGPVLTTWNTVAQAAGATVLVVNRWYHVTMVNSIAGNYCKSFLNGVQETTQAASAGTGVDTFILLDNRRVSGSYGDLQIGAVKAWDRPLAVSEIVSEMAQNTPVSRMGLNTWLPLASPEDMRRSGLGRGFHGGALNRFGDAQGTIDNDKWTQVGTIDIENGPPIPFSLARPLRIARYPALAAAGVEKIGARTIFLGGLTMTG